ncbi:MAG: cytochrome c nitrite reductase small subunit [Desulfuromonadaceae bacterium]|nr:cytochrome c nitrite reductase small subunit [Desulfuromonadaceae bacterium]
MENFLSSKTALWLVVCLGGVAGLGLYTLHYAEGLSYLSADPRACVNCHIMRPQFDSWQKSGHHHVATCVDCHLPHTFVAKYIAKAENGYHHSKGFTFQDFHEPIQIKEKNARILQANCILCHGDLVHALRPEGDRPGQVLNCVHCHAGAGHGPRTGLGGFYSKDEIRGGFR